MKIEEVLETKISYQDHFWTKEIKEISLKSALNAIKSNKYKDITNNLRSFYDNKEYEKYKIHKSKLPVVTFGGTFDAKRRRENLKNYNSIIVLDIDKLTQEELERIKGRLSNDNCIFSFWESPSRKGIKGLVYLNYEFDISEYGIDYSHKIAFNQLVDYMKIEHDIELDMSGSDITRLCFLSYDYQLTVKNAIHSFNVVYQELKSKKDSESLKKELKTKVGSKNILYNPEGKNNQMNKKRIKTIIKYLKTNKKSITESYEEWYKVAFAIANTFTYDIGLKYYIELCELDANFDKSNSENMLINCYENTKGDISFKTILFFATEKKFIFK